MSREQVRASIYKERGLNPKGLKFKPLKDLTGAEKDLYDIYTQEMKNINRRQPTYDTVNRLMQIRDNLTEKGIISYSNKTIKKSNQIIDNFISDDQKMEELRPEQLNDMLNYVNRYTDRLEQSEPQKYYTPVADRNLNIDEFKIESEQPREKRIQQEEYVERQRSAGFEQIPRDVLRERLLGRVSELKEKLGLPRGVQLPQIIQLGEVEYDDPYYSTGRMPQGEQGRLTRANGPPSSYGQIYEGEVFDPSNPSATPMYSNIDPSLLPGYGIAEVQKYRPKMPSRRPPPRPPQQGRMPEGEQGRLTRGENNIGQIREMETVEPSLLPGYGIAEVQKYRPKMPSRLPPRRPIENEEQKHDFGTSGMDGSQHQVQLDDNILKMEKPLDGPQVLSALESSIDLFTDLYKMLPENKDIFQFYENLRRKDQNQADELLNDIIGEVEVLSGGNKDSLFNAQDLTQTQTVNQHNGFPLSGQQRGQNARHLTDIDESKIDLPGPNEVAGEISLVDVNGVNVFRNRNLANLPQREQPGSIEETIRNNIKLSEGWSARYGEQDRGFIRDQYASQDSRSDLLMKVAHKKLNKWNPYLGSSYTGIMRDSGMGDIQLPPETMQMSGDRVVQGGLNVPQGVAPLSIEQARAKPSGYRQPNRKYKGNAVELLRQSNRTSQALANEFM